MYDNEVNWAKLPKSIVKEIGSYIDKGFLLDVRLVNKYWLKYLNEIAFYSLEIWNPRSIPELIKKHSNCIRSWSSAFRNEGYSELVIENVKSLESISWNSSYGSIETLNKLLTKFQAIKSLSIEIGCIWEEEKVYFDLLNLIRSLKSLFTLKFQSDTLPLQPLLYNVEHFNLQNIFLKCNFTNIVSASIASAKPRSLKSLNISSHHCCGDGDPTKETVLSPNSFELHTSLEHISLNATGKVNNRRIHGYYGKELLTAFENPKFKNLKSFSWTLDGMSSHDYAVPIFNTSVGLNPIHFPKLTFLSLELCDSRLLSLISIQFPNLLELKLNCPLPLPHSESDNGTFKHLSKLTISSYYWIAVQSPSKVQKMFPAVSTLKLTDMLIYSNDHTADLSKIPVIFPNVKNLISLYIHESWHVLLDVNSSYSWEVLYIHVYGEEAAKITKLISKLPNLKILYLSNYQNDLKENGFKYNGDACVVRVSGMCHESYTTESFQRLS
jgi:hypothetical protein